MCYTVVHPVALGNIFHDEQCVDFNINRQVLEIAFSENCFIICCILPRGEMYAYMAGRCILSKMATDSYFIVLPPSG